MSIITSMPATEPAFCDSSNALDFVSGIKKKGVQLAPCCCELSPATRS